MEASPIKLGVIGVMLLIGILTLSFAFEGGGLQVNTTEEVPNEPSPEATTDGGGNKPDKNEPVEGTLLGVYNATTDSGLAATVGRELEREGYVTVELGNATDAQKQTVVYFAKPANQASAEQLAQTQFPGAPVKAKPDDMTVVVDGRETAPNREAQVLVVVGADYIS